MKSKSLQLQSNKSKKEQQKQNKKKYKKNLLLFYVLYLILGNVSGVVPLVAGWRETKLKCTIGLRGKTAVYDFFFCFLLWTISKWISLLLQMFSLVLFGGARLATLPVSDAHRPVGQSGGGPVRVGRGGGGSTECLSAVVLWVSAGWFARSDGDPATQHFLLGWHQAPLDPPSVWQEAAPPRLANHGTQPHMGFSDRACQHSTLLSTCPLSHLSVLWHKDHFSWKMKQSYFWNICQCSLYFYYYFFFGSYRLSLSFTMYYFVIFVYMQWSTK